MKKLLSAACILTAIAYQPAQARSYNYEFAGQGAHNYVIIDGERYARIPEQSAPRVETPRYELQRQAEPRYELRRVDVPRYETRRVAGPRYETRRVVEIQPRYTTTQYQEETPHLKIAWDVKPYIGVDYGMTDFTFTTYEDDIVDVEEAYNTKPNFWGAVVGLQLNRYMGIEAFYQKSDKATKSFHEATTEFSDASLKTSMSYKAYGVDLLGYLPLYDSLDLVLGLGLAKHDFSASVDVSIFNNSIDRSYKYHEKVSADSMAGRFGLGLQYNINEHLALRAMGRYIDFFDDDEFEKMIEFSLGLRYFF